MKNAKLFLIAASIIVALTASAEAGPREDIIAGFTAEGAGAPNPDNGKMMFNKNYASGKPDTPGCTTCHGSNPSQGGETRTGKPIDPMAVSKTPDRFTDKAKVDKWFLRNCQGVIGRECTAQEKVDFISFMMTQ
ncbi:MAG: DUF1924 domain-containing protein [Rhodospirillaceae bacterium]|nr:DUF1924 domain-containing protein [Rhodospirillaceae bacterium]